MVRGFAGTGCLVFLGRFSIGPLMMLLTVGATIVSLLTRVKRDRSFWLTPQRPELCSRRQPVAETINEFSSHLSQYFDRAPSTGLAASVRLSDAS